MICWCASQFLIFEKDPCQVNLPTLACVCVNIRRWWFGTFVVFSPT